MRFLLAILVAGVAAAPAGAAAPRVVGCSTHVESGGPEPTAEQLREARRSSVTVAHLTLWGVRLARGERFRRASGRPASASATIGR